MEILILLISLFCSTSATLSVNHPLETIPFNETYALFVAHCLNIDKILPGQTPEMLADRAVFPFHIAECNKDRTLDRIGFLQLLKNAKTGDSLTNNDVEICNDVANPEWVLKIYELGLKIAPEQTVELDGRSFVIKVLRDGVTKVQKEVEYTPKGGFKLVSQLVDCDL